MNQMPDPLAVKLLKDELARIPRESMRVQAVLDRLAALPGLESYNVSQVGHTIDVCLTIKEVTYFAPIHLA